MIEVENLSKRYGEKLAVAGLDFVVQPGVVTGFLGPSGSRQVSQKKEDQLTRDSREPGRRMTTAPLVSVVEDLV